MRKIKFRAWDVKNNKYIYSPSPFDSKLDEFMTFDGRVYHKGVYQEYILEQYTGFKDSDGKEIYENDEIQPGNFVEWGNGCWCVNGDISLGQYEKYMLKIIGTIHDKENKTK